MVSRSRAAKPLVIALNGPQGCGKTTATSAAVELLRSEHNLRGITVSIDDFYLTRAEQVQLAARHAANPYLQQRGYPGTHDIRLGCETIANLMAINSSQQPVEIPPLDYVILEGWCVGFSPVSEIEIQNVHLLEVNRQLARYAEWHAFFDASIQFKAQNIRDTVHWRIEAEQKMRAQGKTGMSDERIRAYIERFLPAYELYLPALEKNLPVSSPRLVVEIDSLRKLIAARQF